MTTPVAPPREVTEGKEAEVPSSPRSRGLRAAAAVVCVLLLMFPIYWMLRTSVAPPDELSRLPVRLWPQEWRWSNYVEPWSQYPFARWLANSVVIAVVSVVLTLVVNLCAGYAFAKLRFTGSRLLFALVIAGLMVPKEAMFVPLFLMFADTGQQNTYQGLFLPRIAFPLGVFIMTQFLSRVPSEYEEAARVDGAGRWRVFWSIMLPLARPAMASLAIFTFVLTWNDFLWPLVISTEREMFTVTTGLASLQSNFAAATEVGSLMARGLIGSLPLLILFLLFQRQLIRGITLGSGEK